MKRREFITRVAQGAAVAVIPVGLAANMSPVAAPLDMRVKKLIVPKSLQFKAEQVLTTDGSGNAHWTDQYDDEPQFEPHPEWLMKALRKHLGDKMDKAMIGAMYT